MVGTHKYRAKISKLKCQCQSDSEKKYLVLCVEGGEDNALKLKFRGQMTPSLNFCSTKHVTGSNYLAFPILSFLICNKAIII